jgi:hypothetical protein
MELAYISEFAKGLAVNVDPGGRERLPEGGYSFVDLAHVTNLVEVVPEHHTVPNLRCPEDRLGRLGIRHIFLRVSPTVVVVLIAERDLFICTVERVVEDIDQTPAGDVHVIEEEQPVIDCGKNVA